MSPRAVKIISNIGSREPAMRVRAKFNGRPTASPALTSFSAKRPKKSRGRNQALADFDWEGVRQANKLDPGIRGAAPRGRAHLACGAEK